ncbi:MAG: hypothetical protein R6V04_09695 [bacterium]
MKKIILACLLFILISGCATRLPKRWAEPNEAFTSSRIQIPACLLIIWM